MIRISANTQAALADQKLQRNLRQTLSKTLHSRNEAVSDVPNWEELRQYARDVKTHTLSRLADYLLELEGKVSEQGGRVIWAETGQEAVQFVLDLAHEKRVAKIVKGKSMLSEEIHLNESLERAQIEAVETDLGEYIVQLATEAPSHIIAPALHKSRGEIADLFVEKLDMAPSQDAVEITKTARKLMREHFLTARIGITGVNFAVAETGTIVIVENEANVRLSVSVPEIHIALMGIEKVIPRTSDLAVFLKLLVRSATGQTMSSYVNFLNGPRRNGELDGPREFYLVLLDNGRSKILADDFLRQTLACIRCGACLNICPVYQRIGGHAYGSTYQGPIGAILTPQLRSLEEAPEHAYASSLCGACYEVCPVKIEIPHILLRLREKVQGEKNQKAAHLPFEKLAMQVWAWVMCSPSRYARLGRWLRILQKNFEENGKLKLPFPPFNRWIKHRDLPALPARSFKELYSSSEKQP
ncbi:LutB/LldF family L-lactate oxidation iron-sulfur protein [Acidobacteria bacterium AH-259-A15]|nr:LutB/LldF family L-lactate oxidation iron-sulfur protein [Acidobacteria bacterium AH-259-A15]